VGGRGGWWETGREGCKKAEEEAEEDEEDEEEEEEKEVEEEEEGCVCVLCTVDEYRA